MDVANDDHLKQPKLIEPPPEDVVLVTYPDTLDGFLAAWVVRDMARKKNVALQMIEKAPPFDIDLTGRNWIIIGGLIHPDELKSKAKSVISIINQDPPIENADKPLPFKEWKRTFPFGIASMTRHDVGFVYGPSLCSAAWRFFNTTALPRALAYVTHSLTKNPDDVTSDVVACIDSYDHRFAIFDQLILACDDNHKLAYVIAGGQAIRRYKEKNDNL
jgi:hypothetical protein